jgi:hypothetical protein
VGVLFGKVVEVPFVLFDSSSHLFIIKLRSYYYYFFGSREEEARQCGRQGEQKACELIFLISYDDARLNSDTSICA